MNLEALYQNLAESGKAQQELAIAEKQIAALREGRTGAGFLRLRALIRMDAGQPDSALADMKESLALNPSGFRGSLQLDGEVLMKMGRTSDAIAAYKKALSIDAKIAASIQKAQPKNPTVLVSKDINLRIKADALGLQAEDYRPTACSSPTSTPA